MARRCWNSPGKAFALGLDVESFTRALGADHVLLLRLQYMVTDRLEAVAHPAVREVSAHPHISELYPRHRRAH